MSERHATQRTLNISGGEYDVMERLLRLRQHQQDGKRSPHKPLLVLLALARFAAVGSSALTWAEARQSLGTLLLEFGPASTTSPAQAAAYPFTRLRSDGLWTLDQDVPMDRIGPLESAAVTGRLAPSVEEAVKDRRVLYSLARALVEAEFPPSVVGDLLAAIGFDPDEIYGDAVPRSIDAETPATRRRSGDWPRRILSAWDRQCAFCGFDGQLGMGSVGLEAAHVRWFNFGGPDSLDNGFALCALHHNYSIVALLASPRTIALWSRATSPPEPTLGGACMNSTTAHCDRGQVPVFPPANTSTGTPLRSSRTACWQANPDGVELGSP